MKQLLKRLPFSQVAAHIHNLLSNRIFIAHNVNFDYTFIRHHLQANGYHWLPKKLCTLKLAAKRFRVCRNMGLAIFAKYLKYRL